MAAAADQGGVQAGGSVSEAPRITIHRSFRQALDLFNGDRFGWLDRAAAAGPLTALALGSLTIWVVTDVDVARTVLLTDESDWLRPSYFGRPTRQALGENLFTLSPKRWKAIGPALARYFRGPAFAARRSEVEAMIAEDVASWPMATTIDLDHMTSRLALRTAASLMFGSDPGADRADELVHHQRALTDWLGDRIGSPRAALPLLFGPRSRAVRRHHAALDAYAQEMVSSRRRLEPVDDLVGALLAVRPAGSTLTDAKLCGQIAGFIGAGNEVTAATLSWALVYGSRFPFRFSALRDAPELARNYAAETIRLSSCAWSVTRRPRHTAELSAAGVRARVERRSAVLVYLRGINHDPACWERPLVFDPERHDGLTRSQQRAFMPFGLGERGCIGQQLAMMELVTALPILAAKGSVVVEGDPREDARFATRVKGGLRGSFLPIASR